MKKNKSKNNNTSLRFSILILIIVLIISIFGVYFSIKNLKFGLDLQGGFEVLYEVKSIDGKSVSNDMVNSTYKIIDKRINALGISEPEITIEGDNIRVIMAGVDNIDEARKTISTTANLTFRTISGDLLMDSTVLNSGKANVGYSAEKGYYISLSVKDYEKFFEATKKVSEMEDNEIVIWLDYVDGTSLIQGMYQNKMSYGYYMGDENLDDTVDDLEDDNSNKVFYACGDLKNSNCLSVATVNQGFASDVIIEGNFSKDDAQALVDLINSGSMPTKLTEI